MIVKSMECDLIDDDLGESPHDRIHCTCDFCEKAMTVSAIPRTWSEKLSRPGTFHCPFCLRHNHHYNNRHILIMTFRCVFGHFYYAGYRDKKRTMYLSQIEDYIKLHERAGLLNPAFTYDPETYLWFVDFAKVGATGRRISIDEVNKTILNILLCFNFTNTVVNFRLSKFYEKYREAIEVFYTQRSRPEGKRILKPTFAACGVIESKELPFEKTRDFLPQNLV